MCANVNCKTSLLVNCISFDPLIIQFISTAKVDETETEVNEEQQTELAGTPVYNSVYSHHH